MADVAGLESVLNIQFDSPDLAVQALTEPTFVNEPAGRDLTPNQRLAHLGDSVLELIVRGQLFDELKDSRKGDLSVAADEIVNNRNLARIAGKLGLVHFMNLGNGILKEKPEESMLAACVEAVLGAVYLDKGLKAAADVWAIMAYS